MEVQGPEYQLEFTARVMAVLHKGSEETEIASATGTPKRKAQLAAAEKAWHALDERRH